MIQNAWIFAMAYGMYTVKFIFRGDKKHLRSDMNVNNIKCLKCKTRYLLTNA